MVVGPRYSRPLSKSGVAAPPGHNQFLVLTFINPANKQSSYYSSYYLHTTFLGGFISGALAQGTCSLFLRGTYKRLLNSVVSALRRSVIMNI